MYKRLISNILVYNLHDELSQIESVLTIIKEMEMSAALSFHVKVNEKRATMYKRADTIFQV